MQGEEYFLFLDPFYSFYFYFVIFSIGNLHVPSPPSATLVLICSSLLSLLVQPMVDISVNGV